MSDPVPGEGEREMSVDAIEKALGEFELIAGAGDEREKRACAMTLLAWVCGEPWTDQPPCAHKAIANNVITANDHVDTTPKMRRELVRAGRLGVLDTWWVPSEAIVEALVLRQGETLDIYERTLRLLRRIAEWKKGSKKRPDLRGVDLRAANLSGTILSKANLSKANLSKANLSKANLSKADLSEADLSGANLSDTNLCNTLLYNAHLHRANLHRANLHRANLHRANLHGARDTSW